MRRTENGWGIERGENRCVTLAAYWVLIEFQFVSLAGSIDPDVRRVKSEPFPCRPASVKEGREGEQENWKEGKRERVLVSQSDRPETREERSWGVCNPFLFFRTPVGSTLLLFIASWSALSSYLFGPYFSNKRWEKMRRWTWDTWSTDIGLR